MSSPSLAELVAERRSQAMVAEAFDREQRGYSPPGERNGAPRSLRAFQVQEIRRRSAAGEKVCDLARAFDVDPTVVYQLLSGRTYRWVR